MVIVDYCILIIHTFVYLIFSDGAIDYFIDNYGKGNDIVGGFIETAFKINYKRFYKHGKRKLLFYLVLWIARIGSIVHLLGFLMATSSFVGVFDTAIIFEIEMFCFQMDILIMFLSFGIMGLDLLLEDLK